MPICQRLKKVCLEHEWLANAFAFTGVALFLVTIWIGIEYHFDIVDWWRGNALFHGLILGAIAIVDALLIFGCLCLGFSECTEEDKNCIHAFRGRGAGKPLFPEMWGWIDRLGHKHGPRDQKEF